MSTVHTSRGYGKLVTVVVTIMALVALMVPPTALAVETVVSTPAELTAALAAGGDIRLSDHIDAGELTQGAFFEIAEGTTVNLDLHGNFIRGVRGAGATGDTAVIMNNGTLTITDSRTYGRIEIEAQDNDGGTFATAAVVNRGHLTLDRGGIKNYGGTDTAYGLDAQSSARNVTTVVSGGEIRSDNHIGVRVYAASTTFTNDFTITSGTVSGLALGVLAQQSAAGDTTLATVTVQGGRIEGSQCAIEVDMVGPGGVTVNIDSGLLENHAGGGATLRIVHSHGSAAGAVAYVDGGILWNYGGGANLATAEGSDIYVTSGTFSAVVPDEFRVEGGYISDGATQVRAEADVAYTVIIQPHVDFGNIRPNADEPVLSRPFWVGVENVLLEDDLSLVIWNASHDMSMRNKEGLGDRTLPFALSQDEFAFSYGDNIEYGNGSIEAEVTCDTSNLTAAGSYRGFMTFEVGLR